MTEKDKALIEQAMRIHYTSWYMIESLEEQAETQEARERLKTIAVHKYHLEEASEGCL